MVRHTSLFLFGFAAIGFTHLSASEKPAKKFTTSDGIKIAYIYEERPDAQTTVIVAPGLGGTKESCHAMAKLFEKHNFLFIDQRGHGQSGGPSHGDIKTQLSYGIHDYLDIVAAIEFAHERSKKPIILYGFCAGAFNSARALIELQKKNLLHKYNIKGFVFDSGWYSIANAGMSAFQGNFSMALSAFYWDEMEKTIEGIRTTKATNTYCKIFKEVLHFLNWFIGHKIAALDEKISIAQTMRTIPIPIFFIHAVDDQIIPCSDSYMLSKTVKDSQCWWIEPGRSWHISHVNFIPEEYGNKVNNFFAYALKK